MKLKLQVTVLPLLFLLLASANVTAARTWTPGVAAGDYFYYEMYGVYTSNRPNITMVIPQFEYNNTEWARINITDVEGSMVYQVYTLHFKNGSETSFNFKTDGPPQNESSLQFYEKGVPICALNLGAGDRVPTAETTINETITRLIQAVQEKQTMQHGAVLMIGATAILIRKQACWLSSAAPTNSQAPKQTKSCRKWTL